MTELSPKIMADTFLRRNIASFGFSGSNMVKNAAQNYPYFSGSFKSELTIKNHFRYGYNGEKYNWRKSSSCAFWTDYGNSKLAIAGPLEELKKNLCWFYENFGAFALANTGSFRSILLIQLCAELGLDVEQIILCFPEDNLLPIPRVRSKRYFLEERELNNFVLEFCETVRCERPEVAFRSYFLRFSDRPVIFDSGGNILIDTNIDEIDGSIVGPMRACLVDLESEAAPYRYLSAKGQFALPNFFKLSPEYICTILKSFVSFSQNSQDRFRFQDWEKYFLGGAGHVDILTGGLNRRFVKLQEVLRGRYPKSDEKFFHPINSLLRRMGCYDLPHLLGMYGNCY